MAKRSAGIVLYRCKEKRIEVLLVHPGGPFWRGKDGGAWSIPKGEPDEDEDFLQAAIREFREETGKEPPSGGVIALTPVKQKGGKVVHAWAIEGDFDPAAIKSNNFSMEWPPHSGKQQEFPEVDRAGWFDMEAAKEKINRVQRGLLEELEGLISEDVQS
jgi:predicted NUDIX family NTP pyrophosphohydrolase